MIKLFTLILITIIPIETEAQNCEFANSKQCMDMKAVNDNYAKNVLGKELKACCFEPLTGFYRDGYCNTDAMDRGLHVVCAELTEEFLSFTKAQGNDLSTPRPEFNFPGLKQGDKWCLCAARWKEAYDAGFAPKVVLESTHEKALKIIDLEILKQHATDFNAEEIKEQQKPQE